MNSARVRLGVVVVGVPGRQGASGPVRAAGGD